MIVVTGCTGYVGRLTAEELARRGHELRLLARDPARAPTIPGAEVVAADYGDRDSLARASTRAIGCSWSRFTKGPSAAYRCIAPS